MRKEDLKKDFIKILESLDRSKDRQEHFRNFCEMAYCAYVKTTQTDKDKADAIESRYMEIVGTYRNKDDVRKMPELISIATYGIHKGRCDFLGEIAGEIEALDKKNGQFFTPYDVSKLMAKMQMPNVAALIEEKGFFSLGDPAAGAGCMLLTAADVVEEAGFNPMDCMSVHAIELNLQTYHMLYLQLSLRCIAAQVIHGNALSLEVFNSQYTPAAIHFLGQHGRLFDAPEKTNDSPIQTITPIINAEQLSLFG